MRTGRRQYGRPITSAPVGRIRRSTTDPRLHGIQKARYGQSESTEADAAPLAFAAAFSAGASAWVSRIPPVSYARAASKARISICERVKLSLRSLAHVSTRTSDNSRASDFNAASNLTNA